MRHDKRRVNVFSRIESIKKILEPIALKMDSKKIRGLVMRCAKYQTKLIKKLNKTEAKAYDLLLKNNVKPKTAYQYLLLEDVPPHIKEKLVLNKISHEEARRQFVQWKRYSDTKAGNELMEEIKNIIRRLRWKSQEGLKGQG